MIERRKTRAVYVGNVKIGDNAPVVVQSMTDTKTHNIDETLEQINRLYNAGCEIVRVAVPTERDAEAIEEIVKKSPIPVIADIHFSPRIAFKVLESGVHGIRLNPGNINDKAEALAESALYWSEFFESVGFKNFKVSIKGSDVIQNVALHGNRGYSKGLPYSRPY